MNVAARRGSFLGPLVLLLAVSTPGAVPPAMDGGGGAGPASWERKLDPFLRHLSLGTSRVQGRFTEAIPGRSMEAAQALPSFIQVERTGAPIVRIKAGIAGRDLGSRTDRESFERSLAGIGVVLDGRVGAIASLTVPATAIEPLARLPEIAWLKAAHAYRPTNEISTSSGQVASDQADSTFGRGAGVVVAVIDSGIDWTSRDFRKADGTTRLLGIWDQTLTDAAHPPPAGFTSGAYYSRADIDAALGSGGTLLTGDGLGHASHVMGTAAGNGLATGNGVAAGTFAGVAPEADLLVVRVFDDTGTFCNACDLTAAMQFAAQTATAAGEPWAGNMSLGDDLGAHDGTDPDELAIDALTGAGTRGAAMAVAAGNSGGRDNSPRPMHWEGPLPAAGGSVSNTFNLSYTAKSGADNDHVWIDLWYKGADSITVQIVSPGSITAGAARGVDTGIVCTADGAIQVDATNAPDPVNGDNEVFVQIWDSSACSPTKSPRTGIWTIRLTTDATASAAPSFDLWNESDASATGFVSLTTSNLGKSVGIPGTARQALTAGSYVDKDRWINVSGAQTIANLTTLSGVGSLSGFSSLGPTRDGRLKPDIAAPGEYLGSTLAGVLGSTRGTNFTERDGVHGDLRGTSMATPHVAGTTALLFGINPRLSAGEVKAVIEISARSDSFTTAPGPLPNTWYGYGKLRALDAGYQAASIVSDLGAVSPASFAGTDSPYVDTYNVYRGSIPGLSATSYGACLLTGLPSPGFTDAASPSAGQAYFYLVTGVHAGVEGILGVDSAGQIEPNTTPCL